MKQKVKQNGAKSEAKNLDIHSGEAGEAKNQKLSEKKLREKQTQQDFIALKLAIEDYKAVLAWDSATLGGFVNEHFQKSKPSELTISEGTALLELLQGEVERLEAN